MIIQQHNTTTVQFAKEADKGTIAIACKKNLLILQELNGKETHKVGSGVTDKDISELPKIVLDFTDTKSIDSMIEMLNEVRQNINYPFGCYYLAC